MKVKEYKQKDSNIYCLKQIIKEEREQQYAWRKPSLIHTPINKSFWAWPATRIIYGMLLKRWWNDVGFSPKILERETKKFYRVLSKCEFTRFFFLRIVLDSLWRWNPHYAKKHYIFSYYEIRSHLAFWYYIFLYNIFLLCVLVSTVWAITHNPTLSILLSEIYKTNYLL